MKESEFRELIQKNNKSLDSFTLEIEGVSERITSIDNDLKATLATQENLIEENNEVKDNLHSSLELLDTREIEFNEAEEKATFNALASSSNPDMRDKIDALPIDQA